MTPLPEADAETRASFLDLLARFAACVRAVDYASGRQFWHPEVLVFGTHRDVVQGLETAVAQQWNSVWPRTADFAFDLEATRVLGGGDGLVVVVAPWTSTGFAPDGSARGTDKAIVNGRSG